MKLIDLLKLVDSLARIVIWDKEPASEGEEPLFEGLVMDVPWQMAMCPIYRCLNDGDAAIDVRILDKDNNAAGIIVGIDYYDYVEKMINEEI